MILFVFVVIVLGDVMMLWPLDFYYTFWVAELDFRSTNFWPLNRSIEEEMVTMECRFCCGINLTTSSTFGGGVGSVFDYFSISNEFAAVVVVVVVAAAAVVDAVDASVDDGDCVAGRPAYSWLHLNLFALKWLEFYLKILACATKKCFDCHHYHHQSSL